MHGWTNIVHNIKLTLLFRFIWSTLYITKLTNTDNLKFSPNFEHFSETKSFTIQGFGDWDQKFGDFSNKSPLCHTTKILVHPFLDISGAVPFNSVENQQSSEYSSHRRLKRHPGEVMGTTNSMVDMKPGSNNYKWSIYICLLFIGYKMRLSSSDQTRYWQCTL